MSVILSGLNQSVTLPDPDFEDSLNIEHLRINRESRGGIRTIYRDPTWPITQTLDFKFSDISQNIIWTLLNFIQSTLGMPVTLQDHFGQVWSGVILNPDAFGQQDARITSELCGGFSIELKFEGVPV